MRKSIVAFSLAVAAVVSAVAVLLALGAALLLWNTGANDGVTATTTDPGGSGTTASAGIPNGGATTVEGNKDGLVTLALNQTGKVGAVSITPREVVEDSRCPSDVQCIQAGRVRVRATLMSGMGAADQVFLLGEPVTTEAEKVTLTEARPNRISSRTIASGDYRFTFKVVQNVGMTYSNASADKIQVATPKPGDVVGKLFTIKGAARGPWYFEASFPIEVRAPNGTVLAQVPAQAQGEWMTQNFVPFSVEITIPSTYTGPATVVLKKDNPSGLPQHDASASYPITIEY